MLYATIPIDFSIMDWDGNRSSSSNSIRNDFSELSGPLAITRDYLMAAQMLSLNKLMEILAIKESQARLLLMHHRWNVERVFDVLDRKGKERLFTESGLTYVKDDLIGFNLNQLPLRCEGDRFSFLCNVCFEEVDAKEVTGMECGHYFCNCCWTEHFITSIDNGYARQIRCMAIQCNYICDYQTVCLLVSARDPLITARFERFLMESFIDDNDRACWCPSNPPCGRAILLGSQCDPFCEVECMCGTQFCFNCLSDAHSPCTCRIWEMWVKRCEVEKQNIFWSEVEKQNIVWIEANTRVCPGCGNAVLKEGGCNHMTCRCGQTFCWLCGGPTDKSHFMRDHNCNRFTTEQKKPRKDTLQKPTCQNLSRYIHYCKRYRSHTDSLEKETLRQQSLQTSSLFLSIHPTDRPNNNNKNWVLTGFEKLLISRRVLTYTYPFAFYMFGDELPGNDLKNKGIRQDLFEDQQQQLECCVEKLTMALERNFDKITPGEMAEVRLRVVSLSRLLDNCCRNMYECIQEELLPYLGLTENIAQYEASGPDKAKEINCVARFYSNNMH